MASFVSHTSVDCRNAYQLSAWWKQLLGYVDIEDDPAAARFVASVNGGNEVVPTLKFSDGSTLTNPNVKAVKAKLN